jgi:hypothetical protein
MILIEVYALGAGAARRRLNGFGAAQHGDAKNEARKCCVAFPAGHPNGAGAQP